MLEKYINRVINADCFHVLRYLPDKSVDLCLTDFPYGVKVNYDGYDDSKDNLKALIDLIMPQILRISKRALITCGTPNITLYPEPTWILSWQIPAGAGYTP